MRDKRLDRIKVKPVKGTKPFSKAGADMGSTLLDFWEWSGSDLLSNTYRGFIAEYIVGLAVGSRAKVRDSWAEFDLLSRSKIKVEVKSTCQIQTWRQKVPSKPIFTVGKAIRWDPATGAPVGPPKRHANVYVFCVLRMPERGLPDPLDVMQWDFYVVPTASLNRLFPNTKTLGLRTIEAKLSPEKVGFNGLAAAVKQAVR